MSNVMEIKNEIKHAKRRIKLCKSQRDALYMKYPDQTSTCAICKEKTEKENSVIKAHGDKYTMENIFVLCRPCHHRYNRSNSYISAPWESALHRRHRIVTHFVFDFLQQNKVFAHTGKKYIISCIQSEFCVRENTACKYLDHIINDPKSPLVSKPAKIDIRMYANEISMDERIAISDNNIVRAWYEKNSKYFETDIDDGLYKGVVVT